MQTTWLLGLYVLLIAAGELIIGTFSLLVLDKHFPSVSVLITIILYLGVFVVAWKLALYLTRPKHELVATAK